MIACNMIRHVYDLCLYIYMIYDRIHECIHSSYAEFQVCHTAYAMYNMKPVTFEKSYKID